MIESKLQGLMATWYETHVLTVAIVGVIVALCMLIVNIRMYNIAELATCGCTNTQNTATYTGGGK
jgi:hypothetical protein